MEIIKSKQEVSPYGDVCPNCSGQCSCKSGFGGGGGNTCTCFISAYCFLKG